MRLRIRPEAPLRGSSKAVCRPQKKCMQMAGWISPRLWTRIVQRNDKGDILSRAEEPALPSMRSACALAEVSQF